MGIIIIKFLSQLLYPLNFSLMLAALSAILLWRGCKRTGGVLLGIALAWLWLWSMPLFTDTVRASLEQMHLPLPVEDMEYADAIVVLGGGLGPTAPPRLYPDLGPGADRVWHAARLYKAGKAPVIIVSGGAGIMPPEDLQPESEAMTRFLKDLGVPESAILLESESRNTHENAVFIKRILEENNKRQILLVTSAMHIPRSLKIFRANGIKAIPAPTDYEIIHVSTQPLLLRMLPDARALEGGARAFKECLGILAYGLQRWLAGAEV